MLQRRQRENILFYTSNLTRPADLEDDPHSCAGVPPYDRRMHVRARDLQAGFLKIDGRHRIPVGTFCPRRAHCNCAKSRCDVGDAEAEPT